MTTEKRCTRCATTKAADDFGKNRTNPDGLSYWCKACVRTAYLEKKGGKKPKATSRAQKAAPPAPQPESTALAVSMAAGFGFDAVVDGDNVLRITQYNSDGDADELVLSRTEAKVLFAQFHDWVHA
jgi:hypothetical protein